MQSWKLDNILSSQLNNDKLSEELKLLRPWIIIGTLATYDGLDYNELFWFKKIFCQEVNDIINGSEAFFGKMLTLKKIRVSLPDNIHQILTEYYNNAYESKFITIIESVSASLSDFIVTNMVNQFGHIRISAEIFRLIMAL